MKASDQALIKGLVDRIAALEERVGAGSSTVPAVVQSVDGGAGTASVAIDGASAQVVLPAGYRPSAGDVIRLVAAGGDLIAPQIPAGSIPAAGLGADVATVPDDGAAPAAPTGLTVNAGIKSFQANWDSNTEADMVDGFGTYELQWSIVSDFSVFTAAARVGVTFLTVGVDTNGTSARYVRVRAVDAHGNTSPWSATVTVTPLLVDTSDITAGAVTETSIADGAISTPKLRANSVTADQIEANSVTADKLAANAVTADKILANSVTADKLAADSVDAEAIQADAIDGKTITGVTITGSTLQTATTGKRVVIDSADIGDVKMWSGVTGEGDPGGVHAEVLTVGATDFPSMHLRSPAIGSRADTDPEVEVFTGVAGTPGGINLRVPDGILELWADTIAYTSDNGSSFSQVNFGPSTPLTLTFDTGVAPFSYDATYQQLGNRFFVEARIVGAGTPPTGTMHIFGLPAPPRVNDAGVGIFYAHDASNQDWGGTARILTGPTRLVFITPVGNALGVQQAVGNNFLGSGYVFSFSVSYPSA